MVDVGVILKRFESPDETRQLDHGKFELVNLGGMSIGRATYQPYVSLHFSGAGKYAR